MLTNTEQPEWDDYGRQGEKVTVCFTRNASEPEKVNITVF